MKTNRDVHRNGALGDERHQKILENYSDALQSGDRAQVREYANAIKLSIERGEMDDDVTALWFMGCILHVATRRISFHSFLEFLNHRLGNETNLRCSLDSVANPSPDDSLDQSLESLEQAINW